MQFIQIPTADQLADCLTKQLGPMDYDRLVGRLFTPPPPNSAFDFCVAVVPADVFVYMYVFEADACGFIC